MVRTSILSVLAILIISSSTPTFALSTQNFDISRTYTFSGGVTPSMLGKWSSGSWIYTDTLPIGARMHTAKVEFEYSNENAPANSRDRYLMGYTLNRKKDPLAVIEGREQNSALSSLVDKIPTGWKQKTFVRSYGDRLRSYKPGQSNQLRFVSTIPSKIRNLRLTVIAHAPSIKKLLINRDFFGIQFLGLSSPYKMAFTLYQQNKETKEEVILHKIVLKDKSRVRHFDFYVDREYVVDPDFTYSYQWSATWDNEHTKESKRFAIANLKKDDDIKIFFSEEQQL